MTEYGREMMRALVTGTGSALIGGVAGKQMLCVWRYFVCCPIQTQTLTNKQTNKQTNKHTNIQTNKHTQI